MTEATLSPASRVSHAVNDRISQYYADDAPASPPLPDKRLVNPFRHPDNAELWHVVTEWWRADAPFPDGGKPDIDIETGEPTGWIVTQYCVRCADSEVVYPALFLREDSDPDPDD